jgi:mono/diheme cytochrome c family protein
MSVDCRRPERGQFYRPERGQVCRPERGQFCRPERSEFCHPERSEGSALENAMKLTRRYSALALVTTLGACSWFTDFKQQPKPDPWESPSDTIAMRGNPQNSVPVYGSLAPGYAFSHAPMIATLDSMASIQNPTPADARSLHNGRMYYQINCAVCHGEAGKGDGPILRAKAIFPPPLVGPSAEGKSDGYIWAIIRNGRGAMPSYNRIEEMDRWDVVNYVRGLQGKYQVAVGPTGLPGETGDKVPGYSQTGPTRPSPYYKHAGSQADETRGYAFPHAQQPVTPPAKSDSTPAANPAPVAPVTPTPKTGGER